MSEPITVSVDAGVARLTLDRPDKRNAVTFEMWRDIAAACDELGRDDSVRLLVVAGRGDHFCAGADVESMERTTSAEFSAANEAADRAIAAFPKPTIAYIVGSCIGGGSQIATACDLRLADDTARFGITPARLGILYPAVAVERTVRLVGASATKHLLYSAEIIDAVHALRIGLIDELVPAPETRGRLDELTTLLATQRSLLTQMGSKQMVDDIVEHGAVRDSTNTRWATELSRSDDAREGIEAFLERRPPRFDWTPSGPAD